MLTLIPMPKKINQGTGTYSLDEISNVILPASNSSSLLNAVVDLADDIQKAVRRRMRFGRSLNLPGKSIVLSLDASVKDREGYVLKACADGIALKASTETGLFYGIQTLRQIVRSEGAFYPEVEIEDTPDFPNRGFYHDSTRGKVQTLETLCRLADKMAHYKLNQLQLYIEHTFAFAKHTDIWQGADPLTAEEIMRLDAYCRERHIMLVPSLSTFGHFYTAIRSKRKEDLNELDIKASELPFSFADRMGHYTLNPSDPRSIALIRDMLDEFLPLFTSPFFNICCDETFDLGQGKNKEQVEKDGSPKKIYVEFLKKIIGIVTEHGRRAMFWGDIIGEDPELVRELPEGTIPLEWDYGAEAQWHDTAKLSKSVKEFYICPGTSCWNRWISAINNASSNIVKYARKGFENHACGMLNTDWGDYGNINMLGNSWHGMLLGAAASWNV